MHTLASCCVTVVGKLSGPLCQHVKSRRVVVTLKDTNFFEVAVEALMCQGGARASLILPTLRISFG